MLLSLDSFSTNASRYLSYKSFPVNPLCGSIASLMSQPKTVEFLVSDVGKSIAKIGTATSMHYYNTVIISTTSCQISIS